MGTGFRIRDGTPAPRAAMITPMAALNDDERWTRLRGVREKPHSGLTVEAGEMQLTYREGEVRRLRLGDGMVALRVYAAVRDENWGTVPGLLLHERITFEPGSFDAEFTMSHATASGPVLFEWKGAIAGRREGDEVVVRWELDGIARVGFRRNRIGFCVLHPADLLGADVVRRYTGGESSAGRFPSGLDDRQPLPNFTDLAGIEHDLGPDARAVWTFEGDAFEMEDQRCWTDASYKTYCTPLSRPKPVWIDAGQTVRQVVELRVKTRRHVQARTAPVGGVEVAAEVGDWVAMPEVGLCSGDGDIGDNEAASLAGIGFVRVEARTDELGWEGGVRRGLALARRLGVGVEMAVFVDSSKTGTDSITALAAELEDMSHLAVRWCVYRAREVYAGAPWPGADRPRLHAIAPGSVCVGTDGDFIFLGRFTGIPPAPADAVCFSINPQVHAFDEHSITETLGVHAQAVATARVIAMGRAVVVSPVTLRPRRNLYTSDGSVPRLDPDPRVKSLWCAGWTLASLAQLALGGAARVTFHATHGPGGVAGTPTADVLRRALATRPAQLAPLRSADPLRLGGAMFKSAAGQTLIVANHTAESLRVLLPPGDFPDPAEVLDEHGWRRQSATIAPGRGIVDLSPYAVATLTTRGDA